MASTSDDEAVVQRQIHTKKFLEARLKAAFDTSMMLVSIFTSAGASQEAFIQPVVQPVAPKSEQKYFTGKLKSTFNVKKVPASVLAQFPNALETDVDLRKAHAHIVSMQQVARFIVYVSYANTFNPSGSKTAMEPELKVAHDVVNLVSQDQVLVADLRSLCRLFLDPESASGMRRSLYVLFSTSNPLGVPELEDVAEFTETLFKWNRAVSKYLLQCREIINFMAPYGIPMPPPRDASKAATLPLILTQLLGVRFADVLEVAHTRKFDWLAGSQSREFYSN
jgi:hypothetical protein